MRLSTGIASEISTFSVCCSIAVTLGECPSLETSDQVYKRKDNVIPGSNRTLFLKDMQLYYIVVLRFFSISFLFRPRKRIKANLMMFCSCTVQEGEWHSGSEHRYHRNGCAVQRYKACKILEAPCFDIMSWRQVQHISMSSTPC